MGNNKKKLKFISPDSNHRYIRKLAQTLDIEFVVNVDEVRKSDRTLIIWNPYGYLAYPRENYIKKYKIYKEYQNKKQPIYIVERGAFPNTIFIDETGFNIESKLYKEKYWNHSLTWKQNANVKRYIKEIIDDESSLEPQKYARVLNKKTFLKKLDSYNKKIVFVPMQIYNDTVTLLWCDWIKNIKNFQNLIVNLAQENPNITFVVKNHPCEINENYIIKKETANLKIVDDFHYKDCITYSDIVLTVNSGLGLQAMIWEKPTIIIGKSFYQFKGMNYKAKSKKEIEQLIKTAQKPDMERVRRFIYYLRFKYYSICYMRKLSQNSSFPTLFEKITYRNLQGQRVNHISKIKDKTIKIFFEFTNLLSDFCLLKISCLDCIRVGGLLMDKKNIYLGTNINQKIINKAIKLGYTYSNNRFAKDRIKLHINEMVDSTKFMNFYGKQVKVPFPVVNYLCNLYGKDWRNFNG